ncbi:MAG: GIY-YIG nuclease family protein [Muribaculaceae bacterium]|nr:GIY-YIG nuclease family protein [Muribaculaceae bacterium]
MSSTKHSPGFRENIGHDVYFDSIDSIDFDKIPAKPGVYILVAKKRGVHFHYPNGKSKVMYIGMTKNLRRRLKQHVSATRNVSERIEMSCQCYQRYHYIRAFGAEIYIFTHRGTQNPKSQEAFYLGKFYEKYYSLPICNSARSFHCN